jgi:hypothetical protein
MKEQGNEPDWVQLSLLANEAAAVRTACYESHKANQESLLAWDVYHLAFVTELLRLTQVDFSDHARCQKLLNDIEKTKHRIEIRRKYVAAGCTGEFPLQEFLKYF